MNKDLLEQKKLEGNTSFQNAAISFIRLTQDGYIKEINQAFAELLGYSTADDFLQKYGGTRFSFLFFGFRNNFQDDFSAASEAGSINYEGYILRKDGTKIFADLFLWRVMKEDESENLFEGVLIPFIEQNKEDSLLKRYNLIIQSIHTIAEEFLQSSFLEPSMERVLSDLGQATRMNRVFLFQNFWGKNDDLEMRLSYDWADSSVVPLSAVQLKCEFSYLKDGFHRWMELLSKNQIISGRINDFSDSERRFFKKLGIKFAFIVPIPVKLDWWGFLCFASVQDEQIMFEEELSAVRVSANIIGAAIQHQQMEAEIKRNEEKFRMAADFTQNWEYWADPQGEFVYSSPAFNQITGFNFNYVKHNLEVFKRITHPDDLENVERIICENLKKRQKGNFEFRIVTKGGEVRWINQVSVPVCDEEGNYLGQRASNQDVTYRKHAEEELFQFNLALNRNVKALERKNYIRMLINQLGNELHSCQTKTELYDIVANYCGKIFPEASGGLYVYNDETFHLISAFGQRIFPIKDIFCPKVTTQYINKISRYDGIDDPDILKDFVEKDSQGRCKPFICIPLIAQKKFWGFIHLFDVEQILLEDSKQWLISIAERLALAIANLDLQEVLRRQSIIDPLTELYNRRFMTDVLEREIRRNSRGIGEFVIIMIDIDNFKKYNDKYGHDAGDKIIKEVGLYLRTNIRNEDFACRYGGDEFTLIMPGMSLEDAYHRFLKIHENICNLSFRYEDTRIVGLTVSAGLACFRLHGCESEDLLRAADKALYKAKAEGKNRVIIAESAEKG